jgi:hypothetical protein
MITVGLFEPKTHYEAASKWWTDQKWPVLPLSHLPATGVVVSLRGAPAAAGWIYKTDSAFCLLEWIVADPSVRGEDRDAVLSVLISSAKTLAQVQGFQMIYMSIRNESLAKRLEANGFERQDEGMTSFICNLSGGNLK